MAAPYLASLRQSAAQAPSDPRRLIVMFTHHGCLTDRWFPARSHGELTEADFDATSLSPIKGFAEKLLMPRGVRGINEWSFASEFGQETDPHAQPIASFFTAHPVDRTSGLETGTPDFAKLDALSLGRSMDHYIADQINPAGVAPLNVHLDGNDYGSITGLSYSAPLTLHPGVGTPSALFANLTQLWSGGGGSQDGYQVARGQSVIDVIRGDLDRLQSNPMSQADHDKLEHWKELLHETTTKVRPSTCGEAAAVDYGISSDVVEAADDAESPLPERIRLMMDLAVLTALCDLNRVILLQFPFTASFDFLDEAPTSADHHSLAHRIASGVSQCPGDINDVLAAIDRWHAEQFAHLLGRLDGFEESSGTLLDNSATVWMMAQADGVAHNNNNLPILHAGSCGGYFTTGRAINVEDGRSDLTPGSSSLVCTEYLIEPPVSGPSDGSTADEFGNAPMNKYLYNLMNAVGVKANEQGFPDPDGGEPVSRFGWSDDPQQYAAFVPSDGIDAQPGDFIDPGEFTALRA